MNDITEPAQFPLFPLTDLQTKGYAQPEPRDDETVEQDEPETEAA
ncbi:hypothetical protein [Streptomyces sp.]|nr:hypothetical protein [Streptomyces sp.]